MAALVSSVRFRFVAFARDVLYMWWYDSFGDETRVRAALQNNLVDRNFKHKINGWTALHWAAKRGHNDIVDILLNNGFDKTALTSCGKTAGDLAVDPVIRKRLGAVAEIPPLAKESESEEFTPSYLKYPALVGLGGDALDHDKDSVKRNGKNEKHGMHASEFSPSSSAATSKKFVLVQTEVCNGKQAFKRFSLTDEPSFGCFKSAMKDRFHREVLAVMTIPDEVLVDCDSDVLQLQSGQKLKLVFDETAGITCHSFNKSWSFTLIAFAVCGVFLSGIVWCKWRGKSTAQ